MRGKNTTTQLVFVCMCGTDMKPGGLLGSPHADQNEKKMYIPTSNKCFCNDKETLNMFKCRYVECLNVPLTFGLISAFVHVCRDALYSEQSWQSIPLSHLSGHFTMVL